MQDWQNLVDKYETVFPEADVVETMSSQGRTMAPLIAGEQQRQISATKLQHTSRLQSQKQLTESLLHMLASAGSGPRFIHVHQYTPHGKGIYLQHCHGLELGKKEPNLRLGAAKHHCPVHGKIRNTFQRR